MTLSRALTASAGFGALALAAGGAAWASAVSSSEPTAWTAGAIPPTQVQVVSGSTQSTGTSASPASATDSAAAGSAASGPAASARVAAPSTPATSSKPAAVTDESPEHERCEATLPGVVVGDPGTKAGAESGFRVWHDGAGWHLRATHPGDDALPFSGVIHSGQPITATGFRLEKGDTMTVGADRHTVTFALVNHGGLDGIDFTDRCAIHTTFTLRRSGHQVSATSIYLGTHGGHPTSNPFMVERRRH
jgi:hypothetical protein